MPLKSSFLFCFLVSIWFPAFAQTLPAGPKVPSIGGGLPKGISTTALESLATKQEIPYLEELRQVQGLKKSYDTLRSEVKKFEGSCAGQPDSGFKGKCVESEKSSGIGLSEGM